MAHLVTMVLTARIVIFAFAIIINSLAAPPDRQTSNAGRETNQTLSDPELLETVIDTEKENLSSHLVTESIVANDTQSSEESSPGIEMITERDEEVMMDNEYSETSEWFIDRHNCNREILVSNGETKNITISFGEKTATLEGMCQITVKCPVGDLLAMTISKVHFNNEVLRVITKSHNINYTMKEFRDNQLQSSLLLPGTSEVYLVFSYNGNEFSNGQLGNSAFHLEVFPYNVRGNNLTFSTPELRPFYVNV